jgi:hypothetical protein
MDFPLVTRLQNTGNVPRKLNFYEFAGPGNGQQFSQKIFVFLCADVILSLLVVKRPG